MAYLGQLSELAVFPHDSHLVLQELAMDKITVLCPHFMIAKKTFQMGARQNGCGGICTRKLPAPEIIQEVKLAFLISAPEPVNNYLSISVVNNVSV